MTQQLTVSIGQHSDKGRKEINQDFFGALIPVQPALGAKGITIALADGISSSSVSQIAAEASIKSFLTDYYCTSETWSVKTSGQRVISATNSWLYSQTKRNLDTYDMDKGYVCTLSVLVLKSHSAHIFHIGDSRIYHLSGNSLEPLTNDHRTVLSADQSYLGRAIGMAEYVEIDYRKQTLKQGDIFILATDGVYEHMDTRFVAQTIKEHSDDLDTAARLIVENAYNRDSADNLTLQIVRIDTLPDGDAADYLGASHDLPAPPLLEARQEFEGFKIIRGIHANSRSHIYLASDMDTGTEVALKIPSIDLREDRAYLTRFMMEDWIAQRLNSPHVLKAVPLTRPRNYIYVTSEFIKGQTLAQWMIDNPKPNLELVRDIVDQISKGLRAFHRKEMLHQDLRPENVMIDHTGTVKIIDFGSTRVAGVSEAGPAVEDGEILGTLQYTAPEYFIGESGTRQSDYFSLGVIAYQMLTGKLPFGTQVSRVRTKAQVRKLKYSRAKNHREDIPDWVDGMLEKAVHPNPFKRYDTLTELTADLRRPNMSLTYGKNVPLAQRDPVRFWQTISIILAVIVVILLGKLVL